MNNRKLIIGVIIAAVIVGGAAIGLILSRSPESADISTIHTEAAAEEPETMASTAAPTESPQEVQPEDAGTSTGVTASLETYTSGKVSIQYPVVSHIDDEELLAQVNEHLKANALSVIQSNEVNEETDTLEIKCEVVSVDSRRLTAVYTGNLSAQGAAHPTELFYTNTLDLFQVQDIGLADYGDALTMAGYVLSEDVSFYNLSSDRLAGVSEYIATLDEETLTAVFEGADFPLGEEGLWPESFSYERQGTIYLSMPVPHALGDYVIVSFVPETK